MRYLINNIILCWCLLFIAGCQSDHTYTYYIEHPEVLKKALMDCQSDDEQTPAEAKHCAIVSKAAMDLMALLNDQAEDPEAFGERIMRSEAACVASKNEQSQACAEVRALLAVVGINSPG